MTEPRDEIDTRTRTGSVISFFSATVGTIALLLLVTACLLVLKGVVQVIVGWLLLVACFVGIGFMIREALRAGTRTRR